MKFKLEVGDEVIWVEPYQKRVIKAKVLEISRATKQLLIQSPEIDFGHTGTDGRYKDGGCWYLSEKEIIPEEIWNSPLWKAMREE